MTDKISDYRNRVENGNPFEMNGRAVQWQKVNRLKVGTKIAVTYDDGIAYSTPVSPTLNEDPGSRVRPQGGIRDLREGGVIFDEIVSIKKIGREHVYDIEVEGTRNFVGNGIVAHNTYVSGNVGIGTTGPAYALDVKASGTGIIARFNSANTTGCTLADGGTISCSSDVNLKKNIEDLTGFIGLDAVMALRPVTYNWKSESDQAARSFGFVAQDVEKVLPKLVTTDDGGLKQLNTIGLIPVLTKSIQELDQNLTQSLTGLNFGIGQVKEELDSAKTSFDDQLSFSNQEILEDKLQIEALRSEAASFEATVSAMISGQIKDNLATSNRVSEISNRLETFINSLAAVTFDKDLVTFRAPIRLEGNVAIGQAITSPADGATGSTDQESTNPPAVELRVEQGRLKVASIKDLTPTESVEPTNPETQEIPKFASEVRIDELLNRTISQPFKTFDASLEVGDVVTLLTSDQEATESAVTKSSLAADEKIVGVVKMFDQSKGEVEIVTLGEALVKVTTANGTIKKGDFLSTSSFAQGYAEKATKASMVIGKALEAFPRLDGDLANSLIRVQVNVTWFDLVAAGRSHLQEGETLKGTLETLTVTGSTSLAGLTVAGDLLISANLNITDVGLGTVTGDLEIQGLGRGAVRFFNNKIVFATDGSITTKGTIKADRIVAREVEAGQVLAGKVFVATTSAELKGLDPILGSNPLEASDSAESSASARMKTDPTIGSGTIETGDKTAIINNNQVTDDSKIFITATTSTGGQALIVSHKEAGNSFTVEIENVYDRDIKFDWWIVN